MCGMRTAGKLFLATSRIFNSQDKNCASGSGRMKALRCGVKLFADGGKDLRRISRGRKAALPLGGTAVMATPL